MRATRVTLTPVEGSTLGRVTATVEIVQAHEMADSLSNVLSFYGLTSIILNWDSGTRTEYTAWEYECEGCGKYGHSIEACPDIEAEELPGDDQLP